MQHKTNKISHNLTLAHRSHFEDEAFNWGWSTTRVWDNAVTSVLVCGAVASSNRWQGKIEDDHEQKDIAECFRIIYYFLPMHGVRRPTMERGESSALCTEPSDTGETGWEVCRKPVICHGCRSFSAAELAIILQDGTHVSNVEPLHRKAG